MTAPHSAASLQYTQEQLEAMSEAEVLFLAKSSAFESRADQLGSLISRLLVKGWRFRGEIGGWVGFQTSYLDGDQRIGRDFNVQCKFAEDLLRSVAIVFVLAEQSEPA